MVYNVLYNPLAGGGTGLDSVKKLTDTMKDDEFILNDMTKLESYGAFFAQLGENDTVILCGGDGTLNRFINDTEGIEIKCRLLYYPAGSGNDFYNDIKKDGLISLEPYIKNLPEVVVNGRSYRFINGIGYGIDGYCCEEGDRLRRKSTKPVNYTSIAIKGLLFHYKPANAVITVDNDTKHYKKVWLAPAMNGRHYGGGMMPTPEQDRLGSGEVSVMVMHGSGKLKTLMIFPSIFSGTHVKYTKNVDVLKGHNIEVKFDRPTALQIDGETISNVTGYKVMSGCKVIA